MGLLEGNVAVVAGAGPGLGRALALAFAREGAAVALGARTAAVVDGIASEVAAAGGRAVAVVTDITDERQCERLVDAALDAFGDVHCLVGNASVPDVARPFAEVDLDDWRRIVDVNVFGTLNAVAAVVPHLKERRRGSIVLVNSMIVRAPQPRQGAYAASKGALLATAQVLAKELGPYGVRVNSLVPGWLDGPTVDRWFASQERRTGVPVTELRAAATARVPLGFLPTDGDAADAAVFLASDLAVAVTGQTLDVNGGEVLH